jgi:FkbM family methyltransferase
VTSSPISAARSSVGPVRVLPLRPLSSAPKGYGFARFQRFVGTTVFHWFTRTEGNVRGPWQPIGGRQMWDGTVLFWRLQIEEMMMANIDAIYLHLIPSFEESRINFFRAYAELRAEGWDVPKVAPFLDPFGIWREAPIDLATADGKDAFVSHYIRFFEQYLAENRDDAAASYLLTVDGKVALTTWWVSLLANVTLLTREEVEARLRQALGGRIPQLAVGIWVMTTALVDPDLTFSDERMVMFSGYAYAIHSVHAGIDVWHVQAGYWDQNIRNPGYLLPRDGGKNYRRAWDIVVSNLPHVVRVYVESWNEYDEGSGIYSADPKGLFGDPAMHSNTDVFSDTDSPHEYVLTTAIGAARINGRPEDDAKFIWHEAVSGAAESGGHIIIRLVVRNEGNHRWTTKERYGVYVLYGEEIVREFPIDDRYGGGVAPQYGIVRGEPVALEISLDVPDGESRHEFTLCVGRAGILFGERLILPTEVDAPSGVSTSLRKEAVVRPICTWDDYAQDVMSAVGRTGITAPLPSAAARVRHVDLPGVPAFDLALHEDPTDRFISAEIGRTGTWEPLETELIRRLLPHYRRFIDLGANLGWYTVIAGLLLRGRGKVHAFEPALSNFRLLEHNVGMNGLDNVRLHQIAVGNHRGTTTLFLAADNQGDHSLHGSGKRRPSARVPLTTLDAHFGALPSAPFLLKADTQGAEPSILAGARHFLRRDNGDSAFIMEFWPFGIVAAGWTVLGYLDAIENLGREVFVIDEMSGCLWRTSVADLAEAARGDLRPEAGSFRNIALLPAELARDSQVKALVR